MVDALRPAVLTRHAVRVLLWEFGSSPQDHERLVLPVPLVQDFLHRRTRMLFRRRRLRRLRGLRDGDEARHRLRSRRRRRWSFCFRHLSPLRHHP